MFNPSLILIEAFIKELCSLYEKMHGENTEDIHLIRSSARTSLEIIANSDAPYHDLNHTVMVTLVGTEIIRGKSLLDGYVSSEDWLHFVISLLNHDIGYVRGICEGDGDGKYVTDLNKGTISPPPGSTDASLTPYHIDRAKLFIERRYGANKRLDVEKICDNIERTRFPVPAEDDATDSSDFAGLIRAADLIGQLGDPQYHRKISALYAEFNETGQAAKMGYQSAADLRAGYPKFFWELVSPYISEGIKFLRRTQTGQAWVQNLYANVFKEEHDTEVYGPERAGNRN